VTKIRNGLLTKEKCLKSKKKKETAPRSGASSPKKTPKSEPQGHHFSFCSVPPRPKASGRFWGRFLATIAAREATLKKNYYPASAFELGKNLLIDVSGHGQSRQTNGRTHCGTHLGLNAKW
jgi:hypothetical protein